MTDSIVIAGFGRENVNGVYSYWEDKNGYPAYINASGYIIMYVNNRMPFANNAGYIMITPEHIEGAINIDTIPYIKIEDVSNVTTSGWTSTLPITSGEVEVETPFYESSSDSSLSSGSSGSSYSSQSTSSSSSKDSSSSSTRSSLSSQSSLSSNSSSNSSKSLSSVSSQSTASSNSSSYSSVSNSSASSRSLSSNSSQSTSSSSVDSTSSSSEDVLLRVTNAGSAELNGDYAYSGINMNGWRTFYKDARYYFQFNGSVWLLSDYWNGQTIARWEPAINGYPDGLNYTFNANGYPFSSGIFVSQINVSEFSLSSLSTQSSSSSS